MQEKKGISLIVLVITIIVMIILAASVVITLSNTGVINKANQAVDATNQSQVQDLAALMWADAYMSNLRGEDLVEEVTTKLAEQGVKAEAWNINVTDTGVTVTSKNNGNVTPTTLGSLVTAADYGKTVNYSVTIEEGEFAGTYSNWKVYYEDETNGYVYIISDRIGSKGLGIYENSTYTGYGDASALTTEQLALYKKFKLGQDGYTLNSTNANSNAVAYLITDFADFANKSASYGSYVEGAIGGPTLELMCAGWNAWNEAKKAEDATHTYTALTPSSDASWSGYKVNNAPYVSDLTNDGFYITLGSYYWIASPSVSHINVMRAGLGGVYNFDLAGATSIRPVVCLKSNIPAIANAAGTTTDFEI